MFGCLAFILFVGIAIFGWQPWTLRPNDLWLWGTFAAMLLSGEIAASKGRDR